MNFSLSEDHIMLRDTTADFLRDQVDLAPLLVPGSDAHQAPYETLWSQICELGWPAMIVPPEHGGLGMTEIDVSIVLRECGRTLAPSPFLGTLAGTWALLIGGSQAQQSRWLPQVAESGLRMALATAPANGDIKHGLADMLSQTEFTATAVLYAAWAQSQDDRTATLAAAMALAYASEAYRDATHRSIQMFGAIGFTWEMKNHLYFKRARANAELLGSAAGHAS